MSIGARTYPAKTSVEVRSGPVTTTLKRVLGPDWRMGFLFVLPIVVLVLALVAYPFCYAVYLSMTRKFVGMPPVFVGLENYVLPATASSAGRSRTRSSSRWARSRSSSSSAC